MRIADLHQDFAFSAQKVDVISSSPQSNIHALKAFEECLIFSAVFPHIGTINENGEELTRKYGQFTRSMAPMIEILLEQVKFYQYLSRTQEVRIVKSSIDLEGSGTKFLMSLEGTDSLRDPYDLYMLKELGVRSIGLTWNYDTKFAASCMSRKDYGLTGYGEELVRIANENNMIIDLAHASKQTIVDTCRLSSKPVIVSHGNARELRNHVRNLDDESIEAVAGTGGVIGITAITQTIDERPSITGLLNHAEYIGENFGWEHVALGTDFLGIDAVPEGFEDIGKISELSTLLGKHAQHVLWENPLRVIRAVIPK